MNHKDWQGCDGHPPAGLLLLHIDGELESPEADTIRLHLSECATCQEECEQLERGMSRFEAFHASVDLPNPAPHPKSLNQRLRKVPTNVPHVSFISQLRNLIRLHSTRHLAFGIGCAFICLVACLFVLLRAPVQSVYASRILDDALHASDALTSHSKVLNQRVRLQRGNLIIERSVHHGKRTAMEAQQAKQPAIDPQFQQALDLAHINLNDPLNANDFALWRSAEPGHSDRVNGTPQSVTITTDVRGARVKEASLTLSRSGWRPIARSVEFQGEVPIEINEESYDISDSPTVTSEATSGPSLPATNFAPKSTEPSAVASSMDLERSELDLREALHSIGADVSSVPQIWRSENKILYHTVSEDTSLRHQIERVAGRIPYVQESGELPQPNSTADASLFVPNPYPATPQPVNALENRFGSGQAAAGYLESLRTHYMPTIAKADALDQLGRRYTSDTMKELSPDLQARVNKLASSLLSSLQRDAADYLKSLSPVLDDLALEQSVTLSDDDPGNFSKCLHWQENAALAAPKLRDLAQSTSLLFVESQKQEPDYSARGKLISDSLADRSFLQHHLMSTCQLFGSN